ncbi:MAG: hypothetical protein ACLUE7_01035 [Lachnospirales bacterium]
MSVVYVTAYDIADVLVKVRFNRASGEDYETLDLINSCDLLIVDDLGTERNKWCYEHRNFTSN